MEKCIHVEIEGTSPLLMNKFHVEDLPKDTNSKISKAKILDSGNPYGTPKEQAERTAYWMQDKHELCIPAQIMMGVILKAAVPYRVKQKGKASTISLSYLLPGTIRVEPFEIPLGTEKYEIDARGVVRQRNRIVRYRAKVPKWKASFELFYDEETIDTPELLKEILNDAGKRAGIMDYSPRHKGPFGCFHVTKFAIS